MKKQKKDQTTAWVVFLAGALLLSSCVYHAPEEDWERNGKVRLQLDWQTKSNYPSDMTYYFYKEGVARPVVRRGDAQGYEGTLPAGSYSVVVSNTDYENVMLEMNNGYDQAVGKARQISALKSSSGVQVARPANLYGTGGPLPFVGGEAAVVEKLYPMSLVKTLELNVKVKAGEDIHSAGLSGRLTGVSTQVHIPSGKAQFGSPAFMTFDAELVKPEVYTSSLDLFGLSEGTAESDPVELYLTVKLKDGEEVTTFTDITQTVNDAFTAGVSAHIVLDLEVTYDEIAGATITTTGWKEGTGNVGNQ